jgi:hypothetical protein
VRNLSSKAIMAPDDQTTEEVNEESVVVVSDETTTNTTTTTYENDGAFAQELAKHLPWFPFKGIPRFYDIGGFLAQPLIFQKIVNIFVERYRNLSVDLIAGSVFHLKKNNNATP